MTQRASRSFRVIEHRDGEVLRLGTSAGHATNAAIDLLGLLEAELDAHVEDNGWRRDLKRARASPMLIQLETLETELTADGNEIVLCRIAGSTQEFDELCEFICEHAA